MSKNLYVDFHVLQTIPPSCINRDDTGSPKTAVFGGKTRARVSSQAWKHVMRKEFKDIFSEDQTGFRTKNVKSLLSKKIRELDSNIESEKADKLAEEALKVCEIKSGDDKKDVMFFISALQLKELAKTILEMQGNTEIKENEKKENKKIKDKDKEKLKEALNSKPSIDLVLFGRMAAGASDLNYDAASQVAHSISTHAVSNEYDYFTAVDDCALEDNSGAGHLGTIEFNSSTLYRYATVNVRELLEQLNEEETLTAVKGFAEAFMKSMPTGKQNTFANRTLPDMVYVTIRSDQPVNLVNAFERPIVAGEDGYVKESKKAFVKYAQRVYDEWVSEPVEAWHIGKDCDELGSTVNYQELMNRMESTLSDLLKAEERA